LEFGPRPRDVAAGVLIVTEAGGRVTNLDGSPLGFDARKILTSNGKLHRAMREMIAKAWPEADRREAESRAARNAPFPFGRQITSIRWPSPSRISR
jgi:hypothetical protein